MFVDAVKKGVLALSACLMLCSASSLAEVSGKDPFLMLQQVSRSTIERIGTEISHEEVNPAHLKQIAEEELLPHIDYTYAAYKVVGKHFKKSSKADIKAFVETFREYLIATFVQLFRYYDPEHHSLVFDGAPKTEGKKIVTVRSRFVADGKPDVHVDFKLRKNRKTGEWKAFDMVAEGISVLSSRQTELSPLIRKNGLAAVTAQLQEKINAGVDLSSEIELKRDGDAAGS